MVDNLCEEHAPGHHASQLDYQFGDKFFYASWQAGPVVKVIYTASIAPH
jgi:uncharacterized protein (DUF2249 family)